MFIVPKPRPGLASRTGPGAPGARRRALTRQLETLQAGGALVYDVELLEVMEDEVDQGYYTDVAISTEDLRQGYLKVKSIQLNGV